jgi:hypothetical protein
MNNMDLDITNYSINDIIKLFKISYNLTLSEMKSAKKIVLKMHPDKSNLCGDYYIFFSDAYKLLLQIYEYKNKEKILNNSTKNTEYDKNFALNDSESNKSNNKALDLYFSKNNMKNNSKKFNKWFNEQFENSKVDTQVEKNGYGDWLQSNKDFIICDKANNIGDMGNKILSAKKKVKDLSVVNHGITDLCSSNVQYSSLTYGVSDEHNYSSDVFSNLQFQDLKQAHIESVIPITDNDYKCVKKYDNMEDMVREREQSNITPMQKNEALQYLNKKEQTIENDSTINAFNIMKDFEKQQIKSNAFWNNIRSIKN